MPNLENRAHYPALIIGTGIAGLESPVLIERRDAPPQTLDELATLVPIA